MYFVTEKLSTKAVYQMETYPPAPTRPEGEKLWVLVSQSDLRFKPMCVGWTVEIKVCWCRQGGTEPLGIHPNNQAPRVPWPITAISIKAFALLCPCWTDAPLQNEGRSNWREPLNYGVATKVESCTMMTRELLGWVAIIVFSECKSNNTWASRVAHF